MSEIISAGGWCAPSQIDYPDRPLVSLWPPGLTAEDIDWLAQMLWLGEIDPEPANAWELPMFSVRRGGVRFPGSS